MERELKRVANASAKLRVISQTKDEYIKEQEQAMKRRERD